MEIQRACVTMDMSLLDLNFNVTTLTNVKMALPDVPMVDAWTAMALGTANVKRATNHPTIVKRALTQTNVPKVALTSAPMVNVSTCRDHGSVAVNLGSPQTSLNEVKSVSTLTSAQPAVKSVKTAAAQTSSVTTNVSVMLDLNGPTIASRVLTWTSVKVKISV